MMRRMKLLFAVAALAALAALGCGAIQNADHQVNKMTDHRSARDPSVQGDGGTAPSTSSDAGKDSGITSM